MHLQVIVLLFNVIVSIHFETIEPSQMCPGSSSYCFPRIIWMFWEDTDIPEDIWEMISITRESLSNFTMLFLTNDNLTKALEVSSFPTYFPKLPSREKACYIRICLLEKYGGIWIDTTVIVNSGDEMEWFYNEAVNEKSQFISFGVDNKKFKFCVFFIGAPKNSDFVKTFKKEYDLALSDNLEVYMKSACDDLNTKGYRIKICQPVFAIDLLFEKILFENPPFNRTVVLLPPQRSPLRLNKDCGYDRKCIVRNMQNYEIVRKIPFVKFFSVFRSGKKMNRGGESDVSRGEKLTHGKRKSDHHKIKKSDL